MLELEGYGTPWRGPRLRTMESLLRLLPGPQPFIVRYGITAAMVLLTFALPPGIQERAGDYGFVLFVPAIMAAALMFDRGTGFFALALSIATVGLITIRKY